MKNKDRLDSYIDIIDNNIELYFDSFSLDYIQQKDIIEAARYSVFNGGKRIRPVLLLEFCRVLSGDYKNAINLAMAIEFIHTYSLIHDDLPCMDDDDTRRGKPSCHIEYGESTALLVGDFFLTHAFELVSKSTLSDSIIAKSVLEISRMSGILGMIGGQAMDMFPPIDVSEEYLDNVNILKTGKLIQLSCKLGVLVSGLGADKNNILHASNYGKYLGISFQIEDDILDIISSTSVIGKSIGSDKKNNKLTYPNIFGLENSYKKSSIYIEKSLECLNNFSDNDFLIWMTKSLLSREK
ncbi:MAG: polyprenyl synthetase family protein [Oscillospiraceae bacterium]|nr:polyprenyl synthetase family protein [Oscillospiraceae bacterium]